MTKRATFRTSDVAKLVAGAIEGGWPVGKFKLVVENDRPALLPVDGPEPLPSDTEAEAEAEWDKALGLQ